MALLDTLKSLLNTPIAVAYLSDIYAYVTRSAQFPKGQPLTPLSIGMLLTAIPATIIAQSAPQRATRTDQPASFLDPTPSDWSYTYGSLHVVSAITAPLVDTVFAIRSIRDTLLRSASIGEQWKHFAFPIPPKRFAGVNAFYPIMALINTGLSLTAQLMACPVPHDLRYARPAPTAKDDVYDAPFFWSDIIWIYQWAGWGFATIATSLGSTLVVFNNQLWIEAIAYGFSVVSCAFGIAHMALMGVLDQADRSKALKLLDLNNSLPADLSTSLQVSATTTWRQAYDSWQKQDLYTLPYRAFILRLYQMLRPEKAADIASDSYWTASTAVRPLKTAPVYEAYRWIEESRNYYAWARGDRFEIDGRVHAADSPLPRKGFGNIMTTFPEIGQLGSFPLLAERTELFSIWIGTVGLTFFGNLAEGITVLVRTANNELF